MKIRAVSYNNRKKVFDVRVGDKWLAFPYCKAEPVPTSENPIIFLCVDKECGREAFTFQLESGTSGTVHVEQVLEYHQDPGYMRDLLVYKLTLEAQTRMASSAFSKREVIRRLGTSAAQLYRLLDSTNHTKSVDQLVTLLRVLDCEVDLIVRSKTA